MRRWGNGVQRMLILAAGLLLASPCFAQSGSAQSGDAPSGSAPIGPDAARALPFADAHFHVMPYMDPAQLLQAMDRLNIRWAGGALALGGPARDAAVARVLGARYIRATGTYAWLRLRQRGGPQALERPETAEFQSLLSEVEADLRDGNARVIGELHVNAMQSAASPVLRFKIRADGSGLSALAALAAKHRRPLALHAQWDADTAAEFQRLAASNREARIILLHAGNIASAAQIRALLEAHPNVVCDLSYRSPPQLKGRILDRTIFDGALREDWRALIEDHPERFMAGIDDVQSWDDYEATLRNIRDGLLASLSPAAAERLAWKNASAWFGLQ
jgi:hypothetical protein